MAIKPIPEGEFGKNSSTDNNQDIGKLTNGNFAIFPRMPPAPGGFPPAVRRFDHGLNNIFS